MIDAEERIVPDDDRNKSVTAHWDSPAAGMARSAAKAGSIGRTGFPRIPANS